MEKMLTASRAAVVQKRSPGKYVRFPADTAHELDQIALREAISISGVICRLVMTGLSVERRMLILAAEQLERRDA